VLLDINSVVGRVELNLHLLYIQVTSTAYKTCE
jgi:hypothetical protein